MSAHERDERRAAARASSDKDFEDMLVSYGLIDNHEDTIQLTADGLEVWVALTILLPPGVILRMIANCLDGATWSDALDGTIKD